VIFRLPADQFVWKALVRFQGDGSDLGVDRDYSIGTPRVAPDGGPLPDRIVAPTFGKGPDVDVPVAIDAIVPPTVLRNGALLTYTVRLLTGAGAESSPTPLTVSIQ
jgi:hypothetical protein